MAKTKKKGKLPENLKGVKCNLPMFRLAFPVLFKPEPYKDGGRPTFNATALIPKESKDPVFKEKFLKMKKAIHMATVEAFGPDKSKWPRDLFNPLQDGDNKAEYEGYADHWYINTKTYSKPAVIDRSGERILEESDIYPGCYCDAVVVFKATESGSDLFISAYLQGVRKLKEGENLAGGCSASDFDEVPEYDDDDGSTDYNDSGDNEDVDSMNF